MRALLLLTLVLWANLALHAASAKVIKVLPQYVDREGRHALSPSLFDRDAYQLHLRRHPEERSGMRFAVQWKAPRSATLKLRLELRGARGKEATNAVLEEPIQGRGFFRTWTALKLAGEEYAKFGDLIAWRATLWSGAQAVAEQKSFLWQ